MVSSAQSYSIRARLNQNVCDSALFSTPADPRSVDWPSSLPILPSPRRTNAPQQPPCERCGLAIQERVLGSEHIDIANLLNNLAAVHTHQGRINEAALRFERSLAVAEQALGSDHPDIPGFLNNLANNYRSQGRLEEAEPLLKRVLAIERKTQGPDDPEVAEGLLSLASLYRDQGRNEQAASLYEQAAVILEQAFEHGQIKNAETEHYKNLLARIQDASRQLADSMRRSPGTNKHTEIDNRTQ